MSKTVLLEARLRLGYSDWVSSGSMLIACGGAGNNEFLYCSLPLLACLLNYLHLMHWALGRRSCAARSRVFFISALLIFVGEQIPNVSKTYVGINSFFAITLTCPPKSPAVDSSIDLSLCLQSLIHAHAP